jgi:dephospho-CoA kinase
MSDTISGYALSGKIGAGKTTICQMIIDYHGANKAAVASFAKPLKVLAVEILGRSIEKARDRKLLQAIGMGMRSSELREEGIPALISYLIQNHPTYIETSTMSIPEKGQLINSVLGYCDKHIWGYKDHWADQLPNTVKQMKAQGIQHVVIEDMRFINEHKVAKNLGLKSVRVECDEDIRLARLIARDGKYDPKVEEDSSEQEWPLIPFDLLLRTEDEEHVKKTVSYWVKGDSKEEIEITIS